MKAHPITPYTRSLVLVAALLVATFNPVDARGQIAGNSKGDASALERCSKILKYGSLVSVSEPTKVDAVHAMGLLGDEKAVPLLIEHLENETNDHLRSQIVRALGWVGSATAVPALEKALSDKYPFVRQQSAAALKKITGKDYEFDKTGLPSREKMKEFLERHGVEKKG